MYDERNVSVSSVARCLDCFVYLAFCRSFGLTFTLVIVLLAAAEAELDLAPSVLIKVDRERYEGQSLLGLNCSVKLIDLFAVHQKSTHSERVDVVAVALLIRRNVHSRNNEFTLAGDLGIALRMDLISVPVSTMPAS